MNQETSVVIDAHQPRPARLRFLAVLFGLSLGVPQTVVSQDFLRVEPYQERGEAEPERPGKPADKQTIADAMERLRRSVNGKAIVHNCHQSKGHDVKVEEGSEITQITGCDLILKTRKMTTLQDGPRELEFTLYAHLADLTTPASVEPQSFSECKPATGAILKVMSRAQPGKRVRATRRSMAESANGASKAEQPETQITTGDLSFFFSDADMARKAARALDQALKVCGATEWPDEDDLP
jgi:hypothetical protein